MSTLLRSGSLVHLDDDHDGPPCPLDIYRPDPADADAALALFRDTPSTDDDRPWLAAEKAWHKAEERKGDPIGLHLCCQGIIATLLRSMARQKVASSVDYAAAIGCLGELEQLEVPAFRRSALAVALADVADYHLLGGSGPTEQLLARALLLTAAEAEEWGCEDYTDYLDADAAWTQAAIDFVMEG